MQDRVTIETHICEQTVRQQADGYAELPLEGAYTLSDPRNFPVIRVVSERTEQTEFYEPLPCRDGRWKHTIRRLMPMLRCCSAANTRPSAAWRLRNSWPTIWR